MTASTDLITAEEYAELPADNTPSELVRGKVVHSAMFGAKDGGVAWMIGWLLGQVVVPARLGRLFAATGYLMSRDPDTVRGASMSFIRRARLRQIPDLSKYVRIPPDLAAEVISPGERRSKIDAKSAEWLRFGVRLLWNVNPRTRTVTVLRPGTEPVVLEENDTLDGGEVIPGFRCRVADIFE